MSAMIPLAVRVCPWRLSPSRCCSAGCRQPPLRSYRSCWSTGSARRPRRGTTTLPQLSTRRYGDDAPRVYEERDGKAAQERPCLAGCDDFRIDFSDLPTGFDLLAVANVPTRRKAGELKVVIDAIKRSPAPRKSSWWATASAASRRAPTSRASATTATAAPSRTAGRRGADHDLDAEPGERARQALRPARSAGLHAGRHREPPGPSARVTLLTELNRQAWPAGTTVHSIVSNNAGRNSDDVVTITSQDLTAISRYEVLPDASRWLQAFDRDGVLHLRVHNEPTTSRSSPESSGTSTTSWASWPADRARFGRDDSGVGRLSCGAASILS